MLRKIGSNIVETRDDYLVVHKSRKGQTVEVLFYIADEWLLRTFTICLKGTKTAVYATIIAYEKPEPYNYVYTHKFVHRVLMQAKGDEYVDHSNGNTLDNRRNNLRLCSNGENCRNQKLKATNKSGYKGVHYSKKIRRWVAQITTDYKVKHLGCFATAIEAALAYNEAAKKWHGDFAWLNPVPSQPTSQP